ncbi:MAG: anion permease [Acidobacteria bacterium]|nr:anion permease [Acidobacteriota bacterium]
MKTPDLETRVERHLKSVGFVAGPMLALGIYVLNPGGHPPEARRLLAVVTLVIVWWMSEALPLPATALLGSALAIAAGVAPARDVLAPYAHPVIFLFLGSFLLAESFRKFGLDLRVARFLLGLRIFASSPRGLLAGLGVVTAALSSALSNTATAALVTPIAQGALDANRRGRDPDRRPTRFESGVFLTIAYAASIGGIATVIGTPPNLIAVGFLDRLADVQVTFTGWMLFAVPLSLGMFVTALLIIRLTLARRLEGAPSGLGAGLAGPGDDTDEERRRIRRAGARWTVLAVVLAFTLWTTPAIAGAVLGASHPLAETLRRHLPEAGVALLCATLLFAAPVSWRRRLFALTWKEGKRVNWGILMLFGGGLSLGTLASVTGLVEWAGKGVVSSGLAASPGGLMLLGIVAAITLSEFASNTASATLLIPVVIATAQQAGFDPVAPALAAALATSCAFVFPVSTPPNAIVFGTGRVPLTRMMRTGALIDLVTVGVVWTGMQLLAPLLPR